MIYPFLLFSEVRGAVADQLFRHEMQHVYQLRKLGWIRFHAKYLWSLIRHGYTDNDFEIDARAHEITPLTRDERRLKNAPR